MIILLLDHQVVMQKVRNIDKKEIEAASEVKSSVEKVEAISKSSIYEMQTDRNFYQVE